MSANQSAVPAVQRSGLPAVAPGRPPARRLSERIRVMANNRENNEFLPAHLEILDTPPSPYAMVFTWTICLMLLSTLAWSCFAKIDIHAVAQGRIQPSGRSKVVQPLQAGKVKSIETENGAQVHAGDLLIELDATETTADLDTARVVLQALDAQIARYKATIAAVTGNDPKGDPDFPSGLDPVLLGRERAAMAADITDYLASREALVAELGEKRAQIQRFDASIAARERLKVVLSDRAEMKKTLVESSSGTRAALLDANQLVEQAAADLAYDRGQLLEAQAATVSIQRKLEQLTSSTVAKQTQLLAESSEKRDSALQDVVKAVLKRDLMQLKAPIDGTVQQLTVTTVGQVVTAGQPLLVIVPSSGPIEVTAMVQNQDIGFIVPGQEAVVKVDAFPFTRYGTVDGHVVHVSRDAIENRDAMGSSDAVSATRAQAVDPVSGTPATQNLVFPVTVDITNPNVVVDGKAMPLTAGMTVSVEIRTGSRRVIDYVLAPIKETTSTAGHER